MMTAQAAEQQARSFRVEVSDGIATLFLDEPGESVNVIEPGGGGGVLPAARRVRAATTR